MKLRNIHGVPSNSRCPKVFILNTIKIHQIEILGTFNSITLVVLLYLAVICFLVTMRTNRTDISYRVKKSLISGVRTAKVNAYVLRHLSDIKIEKNSCPGTLDLRDFTNIILYTLVMANRLLKIINRLSFIGFVSVK